MTIASSRSTQRIARSRDAATTASMMPLPAQAMPSGSTALASVRAASASVAARDDFHTRPSVRQVSPLDSRTCRTSRASESGSFDRLSRGGGRGGMTRQCKGGARSGRAARADPALRR